MCACVRVPEELVKNEVGEGGGARGGRKKGRRREENFSQTGLSSNLSSLTSWLCGLGKLTQPL